MATKLWPQKSEFPSLQFLGVARTISSLSKRLVPPSCHTHYAHTVLTYPLNPHSSTDDVRFLPEFPNFNELAILVLGMNANPLGAFLLLVL